LVISEFLASNNTSLTDNLGNREDWIEIRNAGDAAANLGDYYLTDSAADPTRWRFPDQPLLAGAYIVVFASDRNLAVAGQELHTNFKLGASGEYLGLIRAADLQPQFEYAPSFPVQSTDISYGLLDDTNPNSPRTYFTVPSPGTPNIPAVVQPVFSETGKVFFGQVSVTLATPTPGATIRFTTNGTPPTAASAIYSSAINLTSTTVLRAKAFAPGFLDSPIASEAFTAVDSSANTFNSNLPIVVIDTFSGTLNDTTLIPAAATLIDTGADGRAEMLDQPDFSGRIGIRIRGSSSAEPSYPQKQFAVETWDENNQDKKVPLLGLPAESDWVLYAPYAERSLMQNALAYQWSREMGQYASRTRYVEVYLNTNGGSINYTGDYWGIYILEEKIKGGDDRVDITKMRPTDNSGEAVTGGYIFKKDRVEATESSFTTRDGQTFVNVEPDETEITPQQKTYISDYMSDFEDALFGGNFADPATGYAQYIDVNSWIDFWIANEFTKNVDGFWLSTFFYKDRGGKVAMGPVWDFNRSLGHANYRNGASATGWNHESLTSSQYYYFPRLFQDPAFKLRVTDRWEELRQSVFATSKIMADIDANISLLSDNTTNYPTGTVPAQPPSNALVRNFRKWTTLGTFTPAIEFYDPQGRWIEDVKLMKSWISARLSWIDSQFVPAPLISPVGGIVAPGSEVTLTPQAQATAVDTTILASGAPARAVIPTGAIPGWQTLGYTVPAGWLSGTTGVGYDTNTSGVNFLPQIGLNVGAMQNNRTSVFIRVEFNIADPASIDSLILRMKYDDGFFAWVNGVRVIEANAVENSNPTFSAAAVSSRNDTAALSFVDFDISAVKPQLVAGVNVLAIQGMNNVAASSDMIMLPEIVSRKYVSAASGDVYYSTDGTDPRASNGLPSPSAALYSGPIQVNQDTRIRARTLIGGNWSGETNQLYTVSANSLAITELMYNPAPGGAFGAQEYEWIEVFNHGTQSLALAGFAITQGVVSTLAGGTLAPGGYGVLIKNLAAFEERYGTGRNIVGTFTGSLDNGGERIVLASPSGVALQDFTYDDVAPWPTSPDGGGPSLEIIDPLASAADPANWRASALIGGTPGVSSVDTAPPSVVQASFDVNLNAFTIRFDENVQASVEAADLVIEAVAGGASFAPSSATYSEVDNSARFWLSAPLPDGNYRLRFAAGVIADASGNLLPETEIAQADFFALAADANRDRAVNLDDFTILAANFGLPGRVFSEGNFDYSGDGVSLNDFTILAAQFGSSLPAAGALPHVARPRAAPAGSPFALLRIDLDDTAPILASLQV